MKILYHIPSLSTIYAGRTIYFGYKNAFEDLGHTFLVLTSQDNLTEVLSNHKPDIFISSLSNYTLKFLDLEILNQARQRGMKAFMSVPFWNSPLSQWRINEAQSLKTDLNKVKLITQGKLGDVFYNPCEQDDERMDGFEQETGYKHTTIRLAASKNMHFPEFDSNFFSDVSYVGTYLPDKRSFFQENVFPLRKKYNVSLYGQDWTMWDRGTGFVQKLGQYFNIPLLTKIQKPKLKIEDERKIYNSSIISINIHEQYQKEFGGDCNERTFKIPASGGFEVTDDVACILLMVKKLLLRKIRKIGLKK
jgi:spore maturation protein CgeB